MATKQYDELELNTSTTTMLVKLKGEIIDEVYLEDLVKIFLEEHGYEEV